MQLYYVKATYTNNVYKLGDFFLDGDYKLVAGKLANQNFKPSDGRSDFVTSVITLPDGSDIREQTHFIVPSYDKIYKIESVVYINNDQNMVQCVEDALIGNYLELEDTDIILQ